MAFIIVADSKSDEIERRELAGAMTIGRSPECTLPVRDILLSRQHCVIEKIGDAWVIADSGSKNGTRVNGDLINRHVLADLDVVRIGRTRIAFREGAFIPAPPDVKQSKQRPADPLDAMAGTLSGFKFSDEDESALDQRVLASFPRPRPVPVEPRSYRSEQVQSMILDIASSAWDSVLTEVDRTTKTAVLPKPKVASSAVVPEPIAPAKPPKRRFNSSRVIAVLYIALAACVTTASVMAISLGW